MEHCFRPYVAFGNTLLSAIQPDIIWRFPFKITNKASVQLQRDGSDDDEFVSFPFQVRPGHETLFACGIGVDDVRSSSHRIAMIKLASRTCRDEPLAAVTTRSLYLERLKQTSSSINTSFGLRCVTSESYLKVVLRDPDDGSNVGELRRVFSEKEIGESFQWVQFAFPATFPSESTSIAFMLHSGIELLKFSFDRIRPSTPEEKDSDEMWSNAPKRFAQRGVSSRSKERYPWMKGTSELNGDFRKEHKACRHYVLHGKSRSKENAVSPIKTASESSQLPTLRYDDQFEVERRVEKFKHAEEANVMDEFESITSQGNAARESISTKITSMAAFALLSERFREAQK